MDQEVADGVAEQHRNSLHGELEQLRISLLHEREQALAETAKQTEALAEKMKQDAWEQGYAAGLQQAKIHADEWLTKQIAEIHIIQQKIMDERKHYLLSAEEQLLDLATQLARKVMDDRLKVDPSHCLELVKKQLKRVEDAQEVTLHVAVDDYEIIHRQREELESLLAPFTPFVILPVKELKQGDVMIHSQASRYDARLDSQLSEIKAHFMTLAEENVNDYMEVNALS